MNYQTFYKINAWIDALKHVEPKRDELELDALDLQPIAQPITKRKTVI